MNTINVTDPATKRSYQANGPLYETPRVWCGTGRDPEHGEIFVKLLRYEGGDAAEIRTEARREADVMARAARCTSGIPKLYAHWDDRTANAYVLVMQKMPGTSLRKWLKKRTPVHSDEKTVWLHSLILRQVAQILLDIHDRIPGISHLDLKPENVMIWRNQENHWQVALIDFGTAAMSYSVQVGTYGYQSPEQTTRYKTIMGTGESKDVFALGMMWYELLTGTPADTLYGEFFANYDDPEAGWESRPSLPAQIQATDMGKRYNRLFEKMTAYDPAKRPALRDVVKGINARRKQR